MSFAEDVHNVFIELQALMESKHHDYGPKNIANAPGGPENGLLVRLYDKLSRLEHLLATGADPSNESLRDTFRDIANYGAIGMMVLDGKWPSTETKAQPKVKFIGDPPQARIHEWIPEPTLGPDKPDFNKQVKDAFKTFEAVWPILERKFGKDS